MGQTASGLRSSRRICGSPTPAIGISWSLCHSVPAMADRQFVILRYVGKVPTMASCAKSQRKFFTPGPVAKDAAGAERYSYLSVT